ncbi:MAG: hypothetical protein DRN08_04745, partial [Thermoplasmata archaeon]
GYLSYIEEKLGYKWYKVENSLKSAKITIGEDGKPIIYDKTKYDGKWVGEDCKELTHSDIKDPDDPTKPLYFFKDYTYQGDRFLIDTSKNALIMYIKGMEFELPLSELKNILPTGISHLKFDFVDSSGKRTTIKVNPFSAKFDMRGNAVIKPIVDQPFFSPEGGGELFVELKKLNYEGRIIWKRSLPDIPDAFFDDILNQLDLDIPGANIAVQRLKVGYNIKLKTSYYRVSLQGYELGMDFEQLTKLTNKPGFYGVENTVYITSNSKEIINQIRFLDKTKIELKGPLFNNGKLSPEAARYIDLSRPNIGKIIKSVDAIDEVSFEAMAEQESALAGEGVRPARYIYIEYNGQIQTGKWHKLGKYKFRLSGLDIKYSGYRMPEYVELTAVETGVLQGTKTSMRFGNEYYYSVVSPTGEEHVSLTPRGATKVHYWFARHMDTPYGTPVFVGGLNAAMIGVNALVFHTYDKQSSIVFWSDVSGAAANTGAWTLCDWIVRYGIKSAKVGNLWIFPAMVIGEVAFEYGKCLYSEWEAGKLLGESITPEEYSNIRNLADSLYPAWLSFCHDYARSHGSADLILLFISRALLDDELYHNERIYDARLADLTEFLVNLHYTRWIEDERPYPEGGANATEEEIKDYTYALTTKMEDYTDKFQEEVWDAVIDGLIWYWGDMPWTLLQHWDTYGLIESRWLRPDQYLSYWRDHPDGGGDRPVDIEKIKEKLVYGIYKFWYFLENGGSGPGEKPLKELIPIEQNLDLDWAREWTQMELLLLKLTLMRIEVVDGEIRIIKQAITEISDAQFNIMHGKWAAFIDCVTAIDTIDTLVAWLETLDFADYKLYDTLLPNVGFEVVEDEYESVFKEETTGTTTTLNEEVLTGIRYYWDVRAYNPSGWGPFGHEYAPGNSDYFRSFVPTE